MDERKGVIKMYRERLHDSGRLSVYSMLVWKYKAISGRFEQSLFEDNLHLFNTHVHTCLPGCRPAVCSCTRSCQPQCSSEPLLGDWTRQSFPLPPLEKREENTERERERVRNKQCKGKEADRGKETARRVKENGRES